MTPAFAATGKDVATARKSQSNEYEGAYLVPVAKVAVPSEYALDKRLQKELDETTRAVLEEMGITFE